MGLKRVQGSLEGSSPDIKNIKKENHVNVNVNAANRNQSTGERLALSLLRKEKDENI